MPAPSIQSFAKKSGKSSGEIESMWKKAKEIVKKEYPDKKEDDKDFYQIVTGVLKKMLGINEETQSGDIEKYEPPLGTPKKRLTFKQYSTKKNQKEKYRVYWGIGQFKDFDDYDKAYEFYLELVKTDDDPYKPLKI